MKLLGLTRGKKFPDTTDLRSYVGHSNMELPELGRPGEAKGGGKTRRIDKVDGFARSYRRRNLGLT